MSIATISKFLSPVSPAEFGVHVNDPIEHLEHCHQRIERSLVTVTNAVAALRLTDPVLRTEGAAALDYELALLQLLTQLHTEDEERSLFPRIRKNMSSDPNSLKELMPLLEAQHHEKQEIFNELALCLRTLQTTGPKADTGLEHLETLVGELENVFRPHMTIEEHQLMPHCRQYLTQVDIEEMRQEMRHRFNG